MGISIDVKVNLGPTLVALDQLQTDVRERAAVSGVNKTLAKGSTRMARTIAREFNVTVTQAKARLRLKAAGFKRGIAHIVGELAASGRHRNSRSANLIQFLERSTSMAQARKRAKSGTLNQLHFQIKRAGQRVVIPGAFIGNKGRTVFIRKGKERLPIDSLQTIDIPQMFNTRRVNSVVVKLMEREFPVIFAREVKHYTDRFNKRGR